MRMVERILAAAVIATVSTTALSEGWWDANAKDVKDPVDILKVEQKGIDEESFRVRTPILNRDNFSKKCDIVTQMSLTNGDSFGVEKDYVDGKIIEANSTWMLENTFYYEDAGSHFHYLKSSLRVEYSCIGFDPETDPLKIPSPKTVCDPESVETEGCGNTCQASGSNSQQCASDVIRWSEDRTKYVDEEE